MPADVMPAHIISRCTFHNSHSYAIDSRGVAIYLHISFVNIESKPFFMNDLMWAHIYVVPTGTGFGYLLINCIGNPENN